MARAGRPPQPTALKRLHGTPGHSRPSPRSEPIPPTIGEMEPPDFLGPDAAAEWRRSFGMLRRLGIVTQADVSAFAAYCGACGDFAAACRELNRTGIVVTGSDGVARRSPWFLVKAKAVEQIKQLSIEFGMTASARARIGRAMEGEAGSSEPGGDFEAFLASKPAH